MGILMKVMSYNSNYRSNIGLWPVLLLLFFISGAFQTSAEDTEWRYRRNSLYNIMILHPEYKFGEELEQIFATMPLPERFNDHSLGVRTVKFAESDRNDQRDNIERFLAKTGLARRMVSRWFNRKKQDGSFDVSLIEERGYYDAGLDDINKARVSARGMALLADAGEELIGNTYVVFNDIIYNSRSGAGSILKMFGNVYVGNLDGVQSNMQEIAGFKVTIKSYLYRLEWDDETAARFYNDYYYDANSFDQAKKSAFESANSQFKLKFVGVTESTAQKTSFTGVKSPEEALRKECTRVIDRNLSDLQHAFPDFRIKAPLTSVEPLIADIGLKEGISKDSCFEVLQVEISEEGKLKYKRAGVIRPVEGKIKDNRYMAVEEEAENSLLPGTEFEKVSGGDFYPGMLVREI